MPVPVFEFHEVEDVDTGRNEENLHKGVVDRDEMEREKVDVSCQENGDIERLGLERYSCVKEPVSDDAHGFFYTRCGAHHDTTWSSESYAEE